MTISSTVIGENIPQGKVSPQDDRAVDRALRPERLEDYVGQSHIKRNLAILIDAARKRNENVDHVLLYGSAGLGKTTLAHIIARETGANITVTSGPAIERVGDLGAILTNMADGDVLFIDEIHRLRKTVEEVLYPAMEDGVLDIIVGKGPSARTLQLDLPRFTLIGATTQIGRISNPLRNRFGAMYQLSFYEQEDMAAIISRSAQLLGVVLDPAAAAIIADRSRRTPRIANRLVRRVRDFAAAKEHGIITADVALATLELLDIDAIGLERADRRLLETVITTFHGGPVGVKTLATALSDDIYTIEEVYEPFLIQSGLLMRSPRGRIVTEAAYDHLGIHIPDKYRRMRQNIGL